MAMNLLHVEDLEDDASSSLLVPFHVQRSRSWAQIIGDVLCIASAAFVGYMGDRSSNFFCLLWGDNRIWRLAVALWPVWSFLTLPLLFTPFMASMVVAPHLTFWFFTVDDGYSSALRTESSHIFESPFHIYRNVCRIRILLTCVLLGIIQSLICMLSGHVKKKNSSMFKRMNDTVQYL